jgi:3-hydroxyacyl-[acyl-carrier-protein] dehydratase
MKMNKLEIREILNYLPHRFPFLLIDRVLSCEPGKKIVALKNVAVNEPYFQGHFPGNPVMPGVMILESLAQAAAILSFLSQKRESTQNLLYYFVGIDRARFKRPVVPGDQLILDVTIARQVRGIAKFVAIASVEDAVVTEAELLCTIKEE